MSLAIFLSGYLFLFISILGYGKIVNKYILNLPDQNDGMSGIIGIFSISLIIYFFNFFFKITPTFNLILHFFGLLFFFYNFVNSTKIKKREIYIILVFLFVFIPFLLSAKPHDDFEYYHFAYIHHLNNEIASFGIGNFNHGFRTHSSIFYFTSSFNVPIIEEKLLHSGPIFYMIFSNLILIKKIFPSNDTKSNFIKFLSLLAFGFVNIVFYRMSEHGTDRSAQVLILILIIEILERINFNDFNHKKIHNIMILFSLIISLKAFYSIYLILIVPIILLEKNKINFLTRCITSKPFFASLTLISFFYSVNFINTGCLIYPLNITCFENISWSIPILEVSQMKEWYELWAKAGANPIARVENPSEYVKAFNWVENWIDTYFFNKMSDFILGILLIYLITLFIFYQNEKNLKIKNINFLTIFIFLIFLLVVWFINHPSLRYGGFSLFALLIFIPGSIYLTRFKYNPRNFFKKKVLFMIIVITLFSARNLERIIVEVKTYNYNFINYPSYNTNFKNFKINKIINQLKEKCKNNENICNNEPIKYKEVYNRSLYYRK